MTAAPAAKFAAIVEYARRRIHSGEWRPGQRVPSENELSESFERQSHDGPPRAR